MKVKTILCANNHQQRTMQVLHIRYVLFFYIIVLREHLYI